MTTAVQTVTPIDTSTLKVTVARQALLYAIDACRKIAKPSKILSWVGSLRIRATAETFEVAGCNIDSWVAVRIQQAEVQAAGEMLVPAELLHDVVALSPAVTLALEYFPGSGRLAIVGDDEQYYLVANPVEGFHELPAAGDGPTLTIGAGILRAMAKRSSLFCNDEPIRDQPYHGVHCKVDGEDLVMAGTDSKFMGVARGKVLSSSPDFRPLVLLGSWVANLGSWLAGEEAVAVTIAGSYVIFEYGPLTLVTTVLAGQFPPYEKLGDPPTPIAPKIKREDLARGLRKAALLTSKSNSGVRMVFSPNLLTLSSRAAGGEAGLFGGGSAEVRVPAEFAGSGFEIAFNPRRLLDGVNCLDEEQVTLGLQASNKPGLLRGEGFSFVLMPVAMVD